MVEAPTIIGSLFNKFKNDVVVLRTLGYLQLVTSLAEDPALLQHPIHVRLFLSGRQIVQQPCLVRKLPSRKRSFLQI